jgi:hypothetical protein
MMIGRSDSQQNAGFLRGASTSTGRLAAGCGSHLGPAVADRMQRPDTRPLSTRIIRSHLLHPRGRPHTEKCRSTEQRNTATIGVAETQDPTSEWRELRLRSRHPNLRRLAVWTLWGSRVARAVWTLWGNPHRIIHRKYWTVWGSSLDSFGTLQQVVVSAINMLGQLSPGLCRDKL